MFVMAELRRIGITRRQACILEVRPCLAMLSDNSCETAHLFPKNAKKFSELARDGVVTVVKI
jgi:hypothetical protein